MSPATRLIPRVAIFSALIYVLSWGTSYLPNINFIFFIVFFAGFMWGAVPGILVGAFGMGLWTVFNPFGPATVPVMMAQIFGSALGGLVGAFFKLGNWQEKSGKVLLAALILSAVFSTVFYYLPVNIVDAWVFQPFLPRFYSGLIWMFISMASNIIIFPLLFKALSFLYVRERTV